MYRFLFRTVYRARSSSLGVHESSALPATCDKASISRFANGAGVKAISTGSVRLCEKKDDVVLSNQDEKTNAGVKADPAESPTLATQKSEDDDTIIKMAEHKEETVVSKTEDGDTRQQRKEVKTKQRASEPKQVKSGKASLAELLGAMKVEVTNKRKQKIFKEERNLDPDPTSILGTMESTTSMFQRATAEASSRSETLEPELVSAASAAASTLPDPSQAQSELLRQLRQHESLTEAQKKGDMSNLRGIIADMKVGKQKSKRRAAWKSDNVRFDDDEQGYRSDRGITAELDRVWRKRTLFRVNRLNIFTPATHEGAVEPAVARPTLWDTDFATQVSLSFNTLPRNALEEMIQWTKEGKMWQYPVNNEAGLEEEASVPFHEHIFLGKHLEEGFPRQGPVRHFMELVVTGLSKNPYLTVQQKKEHISWFRDYFQQKEDILKEDDAHLN